MRTVKFLGIVILVLIILSSCNKEDKVEGLSDIKGSSYMEINGESIEGEFKLFERDGRYDFEIGPFIVADGSYVSTEHVGVYRLKNKVGVMQRAWRVDSTWTTIQPSEDKVFANFFKASNEIDAGCDGFALIGRDSIDNWVRVDESNADMSHLKGSFSFNMFRQYTCDDSPYPDTIHIRNGRFVTY